MNSCVYFHNCFGVCHFDRKNKQFARNDQDYGVMYNCIAKSKIDAIDVFDLFEINVGVPNNLF